MLDLNHKSILFTSGTGSLDNQVKNNFQNYKKDFNASDLMLRKELLDKIRFYYIWFDRMCSEDIYMYSLIFDKHQVVNLPDYLYYYRTNPKSL